MKRYLMIGLALGLLVGLSLPAEGASDKPKRGGTLRLAIRKDLVLKNPLVRTRSTDHLIRHLMFESLLGLDHQGRIQPNLAESWEVSKDGKLYTFNLRKGVKFHDGQEMTAEDAKFAIDYTINPKNGASGKRRLNQVKRAEVVGKYTLKVHMKKATPSFLSILTDINSFSVIPNGSLPEGLSKIDSFPLGTGPFKFIAWKANQHIILERFDNYWGHKALIDRLVLRPIKNATVRFTALRAGDVDMVERTPYEWVKQVEKGKIKGVWYAKASHATLRIFSFNSSSPPFNNRKLRQAVAHAINKKEILNAAYFGFGEPADQKYPKGHAWYFDGLRWPSYDIGKAKVLLQEAGYKGENIEFPVEPGEAEATEAATLQAQLRKIGMDIKIQVMDASAMHSHLRKGEFDFRFHGGSMDPDPWSTYAGGLICPPDLSRRITNSRGYCNRQVETLARKAEVELDEKKRKLLFKEIMTQVAEDIPSVVIGFVPGFFTLRDYVKGFTTDSHGVYRWLNGGLTYTWLDK